MIKFQTMNELYLKVLCNSPNEYIFTKSGAFITGECIGEKNFDFEKALLGPESNIVEAAIGHAVRKLTKENVPLMKVSFFGQSITYYADQGKHVVCYDLLPGETLSVESESLLAFTSNCKYSVRFLAQGMISQRGFMTSTITAQTPGACCAITSDGNPIVMSNIESGNTIEVDPDSVVAWIGSGYCDPDFKMDINWKNLIGQASGESYMFQWDMNRRASVIIQPNERISGIDVGIDSKNSQTATNNMGQTPTQALNNVSNSVQQAQEMLNGVSNITTPLGNIGKLLNL